MKKKILFTILTLGCVAGCAAGLSACGGGGGGGDGGEKRLDSVVLVDSNDVEYHEYDMGTFYYGNPEQPDLDSLRLKAIYTDATTEWLDKNGDFVSVTYRYNGEDLFTLNKPYEVGNYSVSYYYSYNTQSLGAFLSFEIKPSATSSPYSLELSATTWKYLEDITVTVKEGNETVDSGNYSIYAITQAKYDEIKNAADFLDKLNQNKVNYNYDDVGPGNYYLFAEISNLSGGNVTSVLKPVTILKGDVIPTNTDNFTGYYTYDGAIGKINLSELDINSHFFNDKPITVEWKNLKGGYVTGQLQWINPDDKVDSTNNGETRKVKFVPAEHDADRYNEYVVEDAATLIIEKYEVDRPELDGYSYAEWDGDAHDIKISASSDYESFVSLVNVTHKGSPITLGNDGLLGTVSEIGEYTYNFALKDKVNYCWDGSEDDTSDVEDKVVTFKIIPLTSWVYVGDNHTIDENVQVKIKLEPYTGGEKYNITPYVADSLEVKILQSYFHVTNEETGDGYELVTEIEAEVKLENDGSYDWIVITVKDFKEEDNSEYSGRIILQLTATGDKHYDNIDKIFDDIHIEKYSYANVPACPVTSGETIEKPIGTTVGELYEGYPELETKLGKWVLYIKYTPTSDWSEVTNMELELPEGDYSFKAVYKSGFVQYVNEIEEVEFTVKGIQN